MNFLIGFGIVALIVLSLFIILVVLMQKPSANAGMGSTLGGGAAEQAFGSDAGNILTRATVWATIIFFVLCFLLFLGTQKQVGSNEQEGIAASAAWLSAVRAACAHGLCRSVKGVTARSLARSHSCSGSSGAMASAASMMARPSSLRPIRIRFMPL